jgi:hypothetical protein
VSRWGWILITSRTDKERKAGSRAGEAGQLKRRDWTLVSEQERLYSVQWAEEAVKRAEEADKHAVMSTCSEQEPVSERGETGEWTREAVQLASEAEQRADKAG